MNIQPITIKSYTSFKSYQDDGIIGFDDTVSNEKRKLLREHYDSWRMPFQKIYDYGHRLTEYQMKLITDKWRKSIKMEKIDNTNIFRGQTLSDKPKDLPKLKEKGIKTVIDLVDYGDSYREEVNKAGLEYYVYNIYANWWDKTNFDNEDIDRLVDFLYKMQKENIYIGCQFGANDTDIAFILNDFFNPLLEGKAKTTIPPSDSDFPIKLNTIYDMLTKKHKEKLGWTKEFEQRLIKKLISI